MEEIIRRCDMPVKKGGSTVPDGQLVEGPTTEFTVGDMAYTIDLCATHRQEFDKCLAPFIASATASSTRASGQAVRKALKGRKGGFTTKDVRKWLAEQGKDVAPSGRLPNESIEEYKRAHSL